MRTKPSYIFELCRQKKHIQMSTCAYSILDCNTEGSLVDCPHHSLVDCPHHSFSPSLAMKSSAECLSAHAASAEQRERIKSLALEQNLSNCLSYEQNSYCIHAKTIWHLYKNVHDANNSDENQDKRVSILSPQTFAAAIFASGKYGVITKGRQRQVLDMFI